MLGIIIYVFCTASSVVAILIAMRLAKIYSIADHPGQHKQHEKSTPFVGGVGLFTVLCMVLVMLINLHPEHLQKWLVLGICSTAIFVTGLVDDIVRLNYRYRLIIQAIVAFFMVLAGDIVLNDLGGLFFGLSLEPGLCAIPFTVFAVIGGINIINMIDGIDGLSGVLSLVSLCFLSIVSYAAGDMTNFLLVTVLSCGICGFLFFNLRFSPQHSARVFLGDNGSMLLGLLFAWLLVDLSQGPSPAMRPVAAIWLLAIPLIDAVSVMHRRVRMGISPFKPDWNHLHHILLKAGYNVEEVVFTLVSLHLLIGIVGLTGLYLGVADFIMLVGFLLIYTGYFYLTLRPWHYIPALCLLHTRLRLTPTASAGKFIGRFSTMGAEKLVFMVSKELRSRMNYWVQIIKQPLDVDKQKYALVLYIRLPSIQPTFEKKINRYITLLQQRLERKCGIELRQLTARADDICLSTFNTNEVQKIDCRSDDWCFPDRRISSQRSLGSEVLVFEVTSGPRNKQEKINYVYK